MFFMDENKDVKIGRVNRGVERALHLALPNDVSVWMREETLNRMAEELPDAYLRRIEGIQDLIKNPDFVAYDDEKDQLVYWKQFYSKKKFRPIVVVVNHEGNPKAWVFAEMYSPSESKNAELASIYEFVRFTK